MLADNFIFLNRLFPICHVKFSLFEPFKNIGFKVPELLSGRQYSFLCCLRPIWAFKESGMAVTLTPTSGQRLKRGKSMSRRRGQNGRLEIKNGKWTVRYWEDVPGRDKRVRRRHELGPTTGPGKLTKSEAQRLGRYYIVTIGVDSVEHFEKVEAANNGLTFRQQAEWWIDHMRNRKRKPTSPQTTDNWEYWLQKWLLPALGDIPLGSVNNKTVKPLINKMNDAGLAPKSIQNYFQVVQMVVASLINEETGEPIYSRKWNREYLDIPVVQSEKQRRPSFANGEQVTHLLRSVKNVKHKVMDALMAGTGMRIGETLALEVPDFIGTSIPG